MTDLCDRARTQSGRRWVRYGAVSAVSVVAGQFALAVSFGVLGWPARLANLAAFVAGGWVSYALNRRWTWGKLGRSHLARELLPFWLLAAAGLGLSTWAVGVAASVAGRATDARSIETASVMAASLGVYGVLWVVKFLVLDRLVFASTTESEVHASSERDASWHAKPQSTAQGSPPSGHG